MIKHIILWRINENYNEKDKERIKKEAKAALEGLVGKIDGLVSMYVETRSLPSSNADMMLVSTFTDAKALEGYRVSPVHNAVADSFVRPYMVSRLCLDFPEEE